MPLNIGLTFDLKSKYKLKNKAKDFFAEFDTEGTISSIENALVRNGHNVFRIGSAKDLIKNLPRLKCDIVFNIAEGVDGRNRESQVPAILEAVGIPYVGSDALTLAISLDKVITKKIFVYHDIPTPDYFVCANEKDIFIPKGLNYPLIVKPRYEGSAKGITPASKVKNIDELRSGIKKTIRTYNQPALVEEFVEGAEFTVGVIGSEPAFVLPVVQRHLEAETNLSSHIFEKCGYNKCRLKYQALVEIDEGLESHLKSVALKAFYAIECRDFARVDFRVGGTGSAQRDKKVYALEINPLPSLAADDYFALSTETQGISYDGMINMILQSAVKRYRCLEKTYTRIQSIAG